MSRFACQWQEDRGLRAEHGEARGRDRAAGLRLAPSLAPPWIVTNPAAAPQPTSKPVSPPYPISCVLLAIGVERCWARTPDGDHRKLYRANESNAERGLTAWRHKTFVEGELFAALICATSGVPCQSPRVKAASRWAPRCQMRAYRRITAHVEKTIRSSCTSSSEQILDVDRSIVDLNGPRSPAASQTEQKDGLDAPSPWRRRSIQRDCHLLIHVLSTG